MIQFFCACYWRLGMAAILFIVVMIPVGCSDRFVGGEGSDEGSNDVGYTTTEGDDLEAQGNGEGEAPSDEVCSVLFGRPTVNTGLSDSECQPSFNCEGERFEAPIYGEQEIVLWEELELLNDPSTLENDPYKRPEDHPLESDKVCGVIFEGDNRTAYSLQTFESIEVATNAGAIITHYGACGLCSSLSDLAVYVRNNDLAGPVRRCGLESTLGGQEKNIGCLMKIGFGYPCAQIWYYNTQNTRGQCLATCLANLNKPYHKNDGSLNECIQCDEDKSGNVFKAVSGRTRRNSGLPTALCRPSASVAPIIHRY